MGFSIRSGLWVKGNLHTHSTNSDGRLTAEQVADLYYANGYGLLSITDHEKLTKFSTNKLVTIPGFETSVKGTRLNYDYHVVLLNVEDVEYVQKLRNSIGELLDFTLESDGLAFIAHPYWSSLTVEDLITLKNYLGVEVYNTGCDVECAKGFSMVHWDGVLVTGKPIYGLAVDDAHRYLTPPIDALGGWIHVKTDSPSAESILHSLERGLFYSSMGPIVEEFSYKPGVIEARFTPVNRIDVVSENGVGLSISLETYEYFRKIFSTSEGKRTMEGFEVEFNIENGVESAYLNVGNFKLALEKTKGGLTALKLEKYSLKKYFRVELTDSKGRK
ncbi:MAG: hypothetical protein QXG56_05625, partial [Candidatus Bathyarchaeia archaeon]